MGPSQRGRAQAVAMCNCDWGKCSKRCECRCHIAAEAHAHHGYLLGQCVGMESAGGKVMEMAVEAFRRGRQEEATMLREISENLTKQGKAMHPGPDVKYERE